MTENLLVRLVPRERERVRKKKKNLKQRRKLTCSKEHEFGKSKFLVFIFDYPSRHISLKKKVRTWGEKRTLKKEREKRKLTQ